MEQLRQLGEVVGGMNALMAFEPDLRINPCQCRLLADACSHALAAVTSEIRAHLRFSERGGATWRALEPALRELLRAFRDAEAYVRHCLDPRGGVNGWWARAASALAAHGTTECVEQHMHGVLWSLAVAIEAVEATGGDDADDVARRLAVLANKYDCRSMLDPRTFQHVHGRQYLVSPDLVARMDAAWKEDRWLLSQHLDEMRSPSSSSPNKPLTKSERRLADVLAAPRGTLHPASILLNGDYTVRRRLGGNLNLKEAQWMGESIAVKHLIGDNAEVVSALSSVPHPNVAHAAFCFRDEERKEYLVVMDQLMPKDLAGYVKEMSSPRRQRAPLFPLLVAVDVMLQVARGMECLHAHGVFHGELNPSNVLVRPRQQTPPSDGGYLHVKIAGFERPPGAVTTNGVKGSANGNGNGNGEDTCIWYAPEVLESGDTSMRRSEKADVYSFGMICFELLTGKVPFEDVHLQGDNDKTSKNIRAGERPLFPFQAPKYLVNLTKRCWHADPAQRPTFASVCRVLRYVKRFLVLNPDAQQQGQGQGQGQGQADGPPVAAPAVDYLDIEAQLLRRVPAWQQRPGQGTRVADVPFQMFAYRAMEREKEKAAGAHASSRDRAAADSGSENESSVCGGDENGVGAATTPDDDASTVSGGTVRSSRPDSSDGRKTTTTPVRKADGRKTPPRQAGSQQKVKQASAVKPPPPATRKTASVKAEVPARRPTSGHGSV